MHTLPDPTRRISRPLIQLFRSHRARSFHAPLLTKLPTNTANHHNYDFSNSSRNLLNSTLIRIDMKLGLWTVVVVVAVAVLPAARGIWLDLPSSGSGTKCVSEELHDNVVVLADYYAFIGEEYDANTTLNPTITVKVTSPYGNNIHHQEKVSHGQFAFTTTESGNYLACFSVDGDDHGGKKVTVGIDWKTGIAAKDWDSVARKEKIEGLELELKKLEESVRTIHSNLIYLINRESEMREVSETTNARVAWYSATSLGICIVVSIVQVSYLRQYFRKKKLI